MNEILGFGYYIVVPTKLLKDDRISPNAKLCFGVIANLSNERGYCFASNDYIGKQLDVHGMTISRYIQELVEFEYLTRFDEITQYGKQRRLYLNPNVEGVQSKPIRGGKQKQLEGVSKTDYHNNISIINKDQYLPEGFQTIGKNSDLYITIQPKDINKTKYRINGEDGLAEFFEMYTSQIPRPEFTRKFLIERKGKPFADFMHLYNDFNVFVNKQFK